jgi:hypothetical protein
MSDAASARSFCITSTRPRQRSCTINNNSTQRRVSSNDQRLATGTP